MFRLGQSKAGRIEKEYTMVSQGEPLVSVLVPTFRRPKELRRTLESVIAQTYGNLEIIVSNNDCENEETNALCRELAAKDTRIIYHSQPANIGGWKNNNFLVQAATGEYAIMMNDDDWLSDNFVEVTLQVLQNDPLCAMVHSGYTLYNAKDEPYSTFMMEDKAQDGYAERIIATFNSRIRIIPFHGLCRYSMLNPVISDEKPRYGEDWIIVGKIAFLGKMRSVPGATYHKRCANDIAYYADFFATPEIADNANDLEPIFLA